MKVLKILFVLSALSLPFFSTFEVSAADSSTDGPVFFRKDTKCGPRYPDCEKTECDSGGLSLCKDQYCNLISCGDIIP